MADELTGLAERVAEALVRVGQVRQALEGEAPERQREAMEALVARLEQHLLTAWRGYRARPSRLSRRAVRHALAAWNTLDPGA